MLVAADPDCTVGAILLGMIGVNFITSLLLYLMYDILGRIHLSDYSLCT